MKTLMNVVVAVSVVSALAIPVSSFAATGGPVTREQVRAELVQLQKAGYNPISENNTYPAGMMAAEARIAATPTYNSEGGTPAGSQANGAPQSK